jgi:uncharacterized protein YccT (UPF0319 family)
MNDLTTTKEYLPTTIGELNTFILIGKQKLIAHKAKIRAIEQTRMAIAAQEAALADTQDMADILLDAEVRMGEILEATVSVGGKTDRCSRGGTSNPLPSDVTRKQSHQAQTLSRNKDIVEQVKAEARENGEIITASKVYQIIKEKPATEKEEESDALFQLKRWWKKATKKDKGSFLSWIEEVKR